MSGLVLNFLLLYLGLWLLGMAFTAWRFAMRRGASPVGPLPVPLPRVSILIAARDEEASLPRCLASLRALNYPAERLEILVGDDGSTDRTAAVAVAAKLAHIVWAILAKGERFRIEAVIPAAGV